MELKTYLIFLLLPFLTFASRCGDDSWTLYKDEKCFKLINKFSNKAEADKTCADFKNEGDPDSTLAVIKSQEEQDFITDLIYGTNEIHDGVWIGATRLFDSMEFIWNDNEIMSEFINWAPHNPLENPERSCVKLRSEFGRNVNNLTDGQWEDVTCNSRNLALCEKWQTHHVADLLKELRKHKLEYNKFVEKTKEDFKQKDAEIAEINQNLTKHANHLAKHDDEISTINQNITKITNNASEMNTKINQIVAVDTKQTNDIAKNVVDIKNSIPVGFLYFQVSTQPAPSSIWPSYTWSEVSSSYAGLFFRVVGGAAGSIGSVQGESAPRLSSASNSDSSGSSTVNMPTSGWSSYLHTGYHHGGDHDDHGESIRFNIAGGEVRPVNTAMRVWKRTA